MTVQINMDYAHLVFALSRRRADRVSVFIGGPCRCVGLHRNHDTVRARADDYSSDRACA
jgi:hypothetical protein